MIELYVAMIENFTWTIDNYVGGIENYVDKMKNYVGMIENYKSEACCRHLMSIGDVFINCWIVGFTLLNGNSL